MFWFKFQPFHLQQCEWKTRDETHFLSIHPKKSPFSREITEAYVFVYMPSHSTRKLLSKTWNDQITSLHPIAISPFHHAISLKKGRYLMPVGHPLFLFSVGERTTYSSNVLLLHIWLSAVRQFPLMKWSLKLPDVDQICVRWSWAWCAQTVYRILQSATRGPSLFSDRNEKIGLDGATFHVEGWNLRT